MSSKFLFGDSSRIFLNLDLGCSSACSYCYLPREGLHIGRNLATRDSAEPDEVLVRLKDNAMFIPGREGTVLSIGCFSETWDPLNRKPTIELLSKLLTFGNPVQVATKRRVTLEQLKEILPLRKWSGQLSYFISSASISSWTEYEGRTERPDRRFSSFELAKTASLPIFLYIKPVIPNVTIKDLSEYLDIVKVYQVPVVVGDRFEDKDHGRPSGISPNLYLVETRDAEHMRNSFMQVGQVFKSSIDAVEQLRRDS